jgi:3-oxoacyl-[acyl-carrier-protein] synthase-3
MNLPNATAFDIVAACTGFINGLSIASAFLENGQYKNALVVGVEKLSTIVNYEDRNTCVLFGDGAGATVLTTSDDGSGVLSTFLKSDGKLREMLWMDVGGTANPYEPGFAFDGSDKVQMNGADVFKVAVKQMCRAAEKVINDAGIDSSEIALVIPHQANIRIIEAIAKRLKVSMEKVYVNIEKYGNTSAASIPLALDEANRNGRIKKGDYVIMVAFGGGLIWGSALIRW